MSGPFPFEIPESIRKAAVAIDVFFKVNGVEEWALMGIQSRNDAQSHVRVLQGLNDDLRKELATERAAREAAENELKAVAAENHRLCAEIQLLTAPHEVGGGPCNAMKQRAEAAEAKLAECLEYIEHRKKKFEPQRALTTCEHGEQNWLCHLSSTEPPALLKELERLRAECAEMTRIVAPDEAFQNRAELIKLRSRLQVAKTALEGVINSCIHPNVALRAAMVNLEPIREALSQLNGVVVCPRCGARSQQEADNKCDGTGCNRSDQPQCASWLGEFDSKVPLAKEQQPTMDELTLWKSRCAPVSGTWMDKALWRCCLALLAKEQPFCEPPVRIQDQETGRTIL